MLVGVLSDTHDNVWATRKAAQFLVERGIRVVLHLGDVVAPFTLRALAEGGIEKAYIVYGNNCGEKLGLKRVAEKLGYEITEWPRVIEINDKRILLLHGAGSAENTKEIVDSLAASRKYDAVLYGHTHKVDVRRIGNTLVLNPGEVCGCLTGKQTIAILDTKTLTVNIIELQ